MGKMHKFKLITFNWLKLQKKPMILLECWSIENFKKVHLGAVALAEQKL